MLYVFHVDMGRMMNFDMTVALSSVENLKDTIERLHGIPSMNIVLLVSGGEMLTKSTQVSFYSAGTDTNPIYMFLTGDVKLPPIMPQIEPDLDLREQVDRCMELPAVYETVMTRAQLALRMYDLARDEEKLCERLVHEQHLQQQGWSAVVANMEDLTDEFRQRFKNFCSSFDRHLEKREQYLELLKNFGDDLTKLSRIPILPGLMALAEEDFHGFDELLDTDEVFARSQQQESVLHHVRGPTGIDINEEVGSCCENSDTEKSISTTSPNKKLKMGNEAEERTNTSQTSTSSNNPRRSLTLLQWISAKENHNTLKLMSDECAQGLGTFNEEVYEKLKAEVQNIIKLADQSDVKEIKGLGERLCKLEEFKYKIKNMVQDQKELSTAFQQNQNRAMNLRDASILPDLCASHQSQLLVMLQNHQKIREHRRCIAKAKDELGTNLHTRLKRIVWIENAMSEFDNRLLFYHRCLRRAERHINIIEQIHQAPCIYVAAVTEVVRRKIFSGEFRQWASKLADDFDSIHSEEIKRRQMFNSSFEGHFLNILFPGMNDMPPAFANENPLVFDARLPNITKSDIDMLSSHLPDLTADIDLPDMRHVINFFVSRSGEHQKERWEELIKQQVASAQTFEVKLLQHQRLVELQREACIRERPSDESETDTEEFEKVVQSEMATTILPLQSMATSTSEFNMDKIAKSTSTDCPHMQSVETLTEENNYSTRVEVERLREILGAMSKLSLDCLKLARTNLETFRTDAEGYKHDLQSELQTLSDKWNLMRMQWECREEGQEKELHQLRMLLDQSKQELDKLTGETSKRQTLIEHCSELERKVEQMQEELETMKMEKNEAITEVRERLIHEHKTEMESLRCRFKLMTSMERSPSDTSLEKIEKPSTSDMIEIGCHEAICAQIRADLLNLKDKEIAAAVEAERSIWQSKIFPMNSESVMANVCVLKEMLEEKEKQLELLRENDLILTKENYQLKTRLDALTNDDGNSWLKEKIEYLNKDKCRLEEELKTEKSRRLEMESSFAALRSSPYEQIGASGTLPRSKSSGSSHKYIVLESCGKGDIVFVVWSVKHGQFMVVQDSQSLYFVHGDSLSGLNLRLPTPEETGVNNFESIPTPYYAIGRVTEKEYCQAKKDENRYRVTKGSKFYRIKLAPLSSKQPRRDRMESFSTSINRSICESHSEVSNPRPLVTVGGTSDRAITADIGTSNSSRDVTDYCGHSMTSTALSTAISPTIVVASTATSSSPQIGFKERTISITSVTEEDDEPVSLLSERCRYISVSEKDDSHIVQNMAATTPFQQYSVITEQPTASSTNLNFELMMASAEIPHVINTINTTIASTTNPCAVVAPISPTITSPATMVIPKTSCCSPSIPTSIGTSEDSDEYRSLEAKDDSEFPLAE